MKPSLRDTTIEPCSSNLEESAFEVIPDDPACFTSDDEDAHTESLASTDGYTGDDASSVGYAEGDEDYEEEEDEDEDGEDEDGEPSDEGIISLARSSAAVTFADAGSESTLQSSASDETLMSSTSILKPCSSRRAQDDSWEETVEVEAFDQSNMPAVYRQYRMSSLRILRHLTRSDQFLRLDDPFKIWYFGEPDHKADVLDKIGSALYVGKNFGLSSQPGPEGAEKYYVASVSSFREDVTLLRSSGIDLYVTECTVPYTQDSKTHEDPTISLLLDHKTKVDIKPNGSIHVLNDSLDHFRFPDIAVFCHTPSHQCMEANYAHEPMSMARDAVMRLDIPVVDVYAASALPKGAEAFTFQPNSLHMSLEGEACPGERPRSIATYPISLEEFRDLDPALLNQHLECITRTQDQRQSQKDGFGLRLRNLIAPNLYKMTPAFHLGSFVRSLLALTAILALLAVAKPFLLAHQVRSWNDGVGPQDLRTDQSATMIPSSMTTIGTSRNDRPTASVISGASSDNHQKPQGKGLGQPLVTAVFGKANHSTQFKAYITGDRHITLIPPKGLLELRKPPRVVVSTCRGGQAIRAEVKELADSVHLLTLPRSEAFGILDIIVRTTSKPFVNQTISVDFKSSWRDMYSISRVSHLSDLFKANSLLEAIYVEAEKAHCSLSNMSRPILTNVQTTIDRIGGLRKTTVTSFQEHGGIASNEAKRLANTTAKAVSAATGTIVHQLQGLVAQVSSIDVPSLWNSAPSVLRSGAVLEARRKAKRIAEKFARSETRGKPFESEEAKPNHGRAGENYREGGRARRLRSLIRE